jgi:hypothetical protein
VEALALLLPQIEFSHNLFEPCPTTYRLTLAEEADTAVVTYKRLEELPRTSYARLAHYLGDGGGLVPGTQWGPLTYCNRTATGLLRAGTQWTKRDRQIVENPINKRNFRTHQYGLERAQANS